MYDIGFKAAVLIAKKSVGSLRKVSAMFNVSLGTLHNWSQPKPTLSRRAVQQQDAHRMLVNVIRPLILFRPCMTCSEISYNLKDKHDITVSRQRVSRVLKSMSMSRKRTRIRTERPKRAEQAEAFCRTFPLTLERTKLFALDEMGTSENTLPMYGWSVRGTRLHHVRRSGSRTNHSTIAVIGDDGVVASQHQAKPYNTAYFCEFLKQLKLPDGSHIILDNVAFHRSRAVREIMTERNWTPLFIPPYQPDFNPIENVFSWVKNLVRKRQLSGLSPRCALRSAFSESGARPVIRKCFDRLTTIVREGLAR